MAEFAKLTEGARERLEMLAEEAGEIVQAVTKILRHGYDSYNPNDPLKITNKDNLELELADLLSISRRMIYEGDIEGDYEYLSTYDIWNSKTKFTHHQKG